MKEPIREIKTFLGDAGRRIEVRSTFVEVDYIPNPQLAGKIDESQINFNTKKDLYIGATNIVMQSGHNVEIEFEIAEANTLEEAFELFYKYAEMSVNKFINEQKEAMRRMMEENKGKIMPATQQDLAAIEQAAQGDGQTIIL